MKLTYKNTLTSCFIGYIVQAISVNFLPLLFVFFQDTYQVSLTQLTTLITVHFGVQLIVDATASLYVDKVGYRPCILAAHGFSATGLFLLTILPDVMDPFAGLCAAVFIYGIGSGLIEVLISPITESCPTDNKETAMQLLHSFYCWGHVAVVLLSTGFFALFGIENWRIMARIWMLVPIVNGILFAKVPLQPLVAEGEKGMKLGALLKSKLFWLFMLMMISAGAAELGIAQWASAFAERGLKVSKTVGDLAGPMAFAALMGVTRALYAKFGHKINLNKAIFASCLLCVTSYVMIALFSSPVINLIACGLCGVSVSLLWPGTLSRASATLKGGGTAMFALLAVGGDLGCTLGPIVVGTVADGAGGDLRIGMAAGIAFPLLMLLGLLLSRKKER